MHFSELQCSEKDGEQSISQNFPEMDATYIFPAAIPVYFVRMVIEVLQEQELSPFEIYFLYAIELGLDTLAAIAFLLGLQERDLATPGAMLLKREMIVQHQASAIEERQIALTEKGRTFLATQKVPPVPIRTWVQLHMNAITWSSIPVERTWSLERMENEGLCILPTSRQERPVLADFLLKDVDAVLRVLSSFRNHQVVQLIELTKVAPEYLAPVIVVVLHDRAQQGQHIAVYRDGILLRAETAAVQRQFEMGHFSIPEDAVSLAERSLELPKTLPQGINQIVQQLADSQGIVHRLEVELQGARVRRGGTEDRVEREKLEEQMRQLEVVLQQTKVESDALSARLEQSQGQFLRTEDHREFLYHAIGEAMQELIIISPWLNRRTCDEELCTLIAQAINRNVHVRIGYGITERAGDQDDGRNRANAQRVIRALRNSVNRTCTPEQTVFLDIQRTRDTHQKILVVDRTSAVLGSFNWLSYRGELDDGYRNETSVVLRDRGSVDELARIALKGWPLPSS